MIGILNSNYGWLISINLLGLAIAFDSWRWQSSFFVSACESFCRYSVWAMPFSLLPLEFLIYLICKEITLNFQFDQFQLVFVSNSLHSSFEQCVSTLWGAICINVAFDESESTSRFGNLSRFLTLTVFFQGPGLTSQFDRYVWQTQFNWIAIPIQHLCR